MKRARQRAGMGTLLAVLGLIAIGAASAQVDGQLSEEAIEELRETIRFGIDEEVVSVLERLESAEEGSLNEALMTRYAESFSASLRRRIMEYFARTAYPEAAGVALETVRNFRGSDGQLVVAALRLLQNEDVPLPEGTEEALIEATERGAATVARSAIRTLAAREITAGESTLLAKIRDRRTDQATREQAILALGDVGSDEAVGTLLSVAQDAQGGSLYRGYAIQSLGRIGAEAAEQPLRQLMSAGDAIVRSYATQALLEMGVEDSRAVLSGALRDSLPQTRLNALSWIREHEVSELSDAVRYKVTKDPDPRVRAEAMQTLGALKGSEYEELLAEIATSRSRPMDDRMSAMRTMIEESPSEAEEAFLEPLREDIAEGRGTAFARPLAQVLAETGDGEVGRLYEALLLEGEGDLRLYALAGIERREITGVNATLRNLRDAGGLHPAALQSINRILGPPEEEPEGAEEAEDAAEEEGETD